MKKILLLIALVGFLSSSSFAQTKKHYKGKRYGKHHRAHRFPAPPLPPKPILPPPPPRPPRP